jgi:hypothetical protein
VPVTITGSVTRAPSSGSVSATAGGVVSAGGGAKISSVAAVANSA